MWFIIPASDLDFPEFYLSWGLCLLLYMPPEAGKGGSFQLFDKHRGRFIWVAVKAYYSLFPERKE